MMTPRLVCEMLPGNGEAQAEYLVAGLPEHQLPLRQTQKHFFDDLHSTRFVQRELRLPAREPSIVRPVSSSAETSRALRPNA